MSEAMKPKCCGKVSPAGSWRSYPCGKNASMEHEGKHYCKTHHPPTVKAKADARTAKWRAEWDALDEAKEKARAEAAEQKRRADCYDALVERVKELEEALRAILVAADTPLAQGGEMWFAEAVAPPIDEARAALSNALPNTVVETPK
jgi:hypothetical protein